MGWRSFDYRSEDLAAISLYDGGTCNVPLVAGNEQFTKAGQPFVLNGLGFHYQTFGSYYGSQSAVEIDALLDKLKHVGINAISLYAPDGLALCSSGTFNGRPIGCWASGAFAAYNPQFWTGDGVAAGFDYFLDACRLRGMYVSLRFNDWNQVFTGKGATAPTGNTLFIGLYHFNGEGGTPTLKTWFKAHLAQFLSRQNSRNSLLNSADYTLGMINTLNEQSYHRFYFVSTNASSPTSNTFDNMCKNGGTAAALYVTAFDADFVAWHTAKFGSGPTANGSGITAMPCHAYTGSMGGSVAARSTFNVKANFTDPERQRIAQYWAELEGNFHTEIKAYVKSLVPHILYSAGQGSYVGHQAEVISDFSDYHQYHQTINTTGNAQTIDDGVASQTAKGNWTTGTLTVTLGGTGAPDGNHTLVTGQKARVTRKSGSPAFSQILDITQTSSVTFTAAISDPTFGANEPLTVVLPGRTGNDCYLHGNPPTDNTAGSTRTYQSLATATPPSIVDVASFQGQGNYGFYTTQFRNAKHTGKPSIASENGAKGLAHTAQVQHPLLTHIFDAMQGGSGSCQFTVINASPMQVGEHCWQGHGTNFMVSEMISLMRRFGGITTLALNETVIQESDIYAWRSKENLTDLYTGVDFGWLTLIQDADLTNGINVLYDAFLRAKLRWRLAGTTAKGAAPSGTPSFSTGNNLPNMTDANVCLVYYHRNTGYLRVETPKMQLVIGRIPNTVTLSKMAVSTIDGKYWYGVCAWLSEDGSNLGVGNSRLYQMMYPREQEQWFARCPETANLDMLDTGFGNATPVPGIVFRDQLEVQLTSPRALVATRSAGGQKGKIYAPYSGGKVYLQPPDPRILLS